MNTKSHTKNAFLLTLGVFLFSSFAFAQYTPSAGQNAPERAYKAKRKKSGGYERDKNGAIQYEEFEAAPTGDTHGNAAGNQYDLAVDGAFEGQTVLILAQTHEVVWDHTKKALKEKGLNTVIYKNAPPDIETFKADLKKSCQFWMVSTTQARLSNQHIAAIKEFFDAGHGVYIWGDNDPYYKDANKLSNALISGLGMKGDVRGDVVVNVSCGGSPGVAASHLITTGVAHLYEGITIATIHLGDESKAQRSEDRRYNPKRVGIAKKHWRNKLPKAFTPILYGSAGNLVTLAYEAQGKRLVIDGGFTRLYNNWDDAGTARYVKNAASWLVNAERFSDKVANR